MSEKLQPSIESKRAKFTEDKQTKSPLKTVAVIALMAAFAVAGYFAVRGFSNNSNSSDNPKTGVTTTPDMVKISLADLSGTAKFLDYKLDDNTNLRFFALKSADGKYRAAMDACETCYHAKKGYRQEGDAMVCNNCGMKFQSQMINEARGGCHPIGLRCVVEGDQLVIRTSDLASNRNYFK